jgi:uncharacterized repeat protein (TIGR02543 family)
MVSNLANTAIAADSGTEKAEFVLSREDLYEALQEAIRNGQDDTDLEFDGEAVEIYDELLNEPGGGSIAVYELKPEFKDEINDLQLRIFAQIEGDIELLNDLEEEQELTDDLDGTQEDEVSTVYEVNGSEKIIFLLTNTSSQKRTADIYIDDKVIQSITVVPAGDVAVGTAAVTELQTGTAVEAAAHSAGTGGGSGSGSVSSSAENPTRELEVETEEAVEDPSADSEEGKADTVNSETGDFIEIVIPDESVDSGDADVDSEVKVDVDDTTTDEDKNTADAASGDTAGAASGDTADADSSDTVDSNDTADSSDTADNNDTTDNNGAAEADSSDEFGDTDDTSDSVDTIASISYHPVFRVTAAGQDKTEAAQDETEKAQDEIEKAQGETKEVQLTEKTEEAETFKETENAETEVKLFAEDETEPVKIEIDDTVETSPSAVEDATEVKVENDETASTATPSDAEPLDEKDIEIYDAVRLGDAAAVAVIADSEIIGLDEVHRTLESIKKIPHPVFTQEKNVNGVTVTVSAEEGVLPRGTYLKVEEVTEQVAEAVKENVEADGETTVTDVIAYDINLMYDGLKLPNIYWQGNKVNVNFAGNRIEELSAASNRIQIAPLETPTQTVEAALGEIEEIPMLENLTAEDIAIEDDEKVIVDTSSDEVIDNVEIEAEHFTVYVINGDSQSATATVTFKENGGSTTAPGSITASINSVITLPEYQGEKTGYKFVGWSIINNATSDGSDKYMIPVYSAGESYRVDNDVTLFATWAETDVTAYFYIRTNGTIPDEPNASDEQNEYTNKPIVIDNAIKVGKFVSDPTGKEVEANLSVTPSSAQIQEVYSSYNPNNQYIIWYVIKHEADWHVDGVLLSKDSVTLYYDRNTPNNKAVTGTFPAGKQYDKTNNEVTVKGGDGFSLDGYVFVGWNTKADGSGTTYKGGDKFNITETTTLYAQWASTNDILYIKKVLVGKTNGDNVSDVKFKLYKLDGTNTGDSDSTELVPDSNGYIPLAALVDENSSNSETTYELVETDTANGYLLLGNPIRITAKKGTGGSGTTNSIMSYVVDGVTYYSGQMLTINNYRSIKSLTIRKLVRGNMCNLSDKFMFTLKLTDGVDGSDYGIALKANQSGAEAEKELTYTNGSYSFKLGNEESITIQVPASFHYEITEDSGEYVAAVTGSGEIVKSADGEVVYGMSGTIGDDISIEFTNTKNIQTPTGLFTDRLPYLLMVSLATLALMGHTLSVYRRRKHDSE